MKGIFLLLGSNIGDRLGHLQRAKNLLEEYPIAIVDYSSVYESAPWGKEDQEWFLNLLLRIDTTLEPFDLLQVCLETEQKMGRMRQEKWGARMIDIDLLYYNNLAMHTDDLILPHPGIAHRRFALLPLCEIAANELHPVELVTHRHLLLHCPDPLECVPTNLQIQL